MIVVTRSCALVRSYFDAATIVFEQSFPHGATATATGSNTDVVSNFPSFGAVASGVDLNYLVQALLLAVAVLATLSFRVADCLHNFVCGTTPAQTYQGVMSNPAMGRWGGSSAFPGGVCMCVCENVCVQAQRLNIRRATNT